MMEKGREHRILFPISLLEEEGGKSPLYQASKIHLCFSFKSAYFLGMFNYKRQIILFEKPIFSICIRYAKILEGRK